MSKLSCEVIKDLLPSYVDGICSKNSKELIEEHISECMDCNKLLDRMKNIEIVADKTDEKEIDYMKKIKRYNANKNLIGLGLLIVFIVIGMAIIVGNYGNVPIRLYYVILPILIFGSYYMLSDHTTKMKNTKWSIGMSILGIILICYSLILEFSILNWVEGGVYPFGINPNKLAPFVYHQLLANAIIQIAIFIGTILVSVKTKNSHGMLLDISITGCCLAFAFISSLKTVSTIESFITVRNNSILILLIEGVLMAVIIFMLDRRKIRSKYTNN